VAGRGGGEVVDGIDNTVQSSIGTDGHIGSDEVIVDGSDEPGDHEGGVFPGYLGAHLAGVDEFSDQVCPFGAQHIQAGERTVTADDDETIDPVFEEISDSLQASRAFAHPFTTEGPDYGAATVEDRANVIPPEFTDAVATIDHSLVALVDRIDLGSHTQRRAHHGPHRGVHTLSVAPAGQDADAQTMTIGESGGEPHLVINTHSSILPRASGQRVNCDC